jgi:hypothetical protein
VIALPSTWDQTGLEAVGFRGFLPFAQLTSAVVPADRGIYAVLRPSGTDPTFLPASPAGWPKGRDPSYPLDELRRKWIATTPLVYVGKANPAGGLWGRLRPFARMASNHSGGRSIWQLEDSAELLVCWIATPGENPGDVETRYLHAFESAHGGVPFANRRH